MTSYDLYDSSGNRVGELRSRDWDYPDDPYAGPKHARVTASGKIMIALTCIVVLWSTWFVFKYGVTFLFPGSPWYTPRNWAGPNRGGEGDPFALLWGLICIGISLIYAFWGTIFLMITASDQDKKDGPFGALKILPLCIFFALPAMLFLFLALH